MSRAKIVFTDTMIRKLKPDENPITREIFFVKRRQKVGEQWLNKVEPMVGRDGFLSIAHRTNQLAGIETTVCIPNWNADRSKEQQSENPIACCGCSPIRNKEYNIQHTPLHQSGSRAFSFGGVMNTKSFFDETSNTKSLRMRVMRPVFSREVIREDMPVYIPTNRFNSPSQVFEMFRNLICETKEHFLCLHLDGKNRIVCLDRVSVGSLNQSIVHVREVMKAALLSSAAAMLLVHNHPSGDPSPSTEDLHITKRLKEAGELIGIPVLDHIIIGDDQYVSFVERGLL